MRSIVRGLVVTAVLASSGCVTGFSQAYLGGLRGSQNYWPTVQAWEVEGETGRTLVLDTGPPSGTAKCEVAFPMTRHGQVRKGLVEYDADGPLPLRIQRVRCRTDEGVWPPASARLVPLKQLPALRTARQGCAWWVIPQALSLGVTVPIDVALSPVYGVALLAHVLGFNVGGSVDLRS